MSEALPVISDEVPATPPKTKALKWTVSAIAIAMSLYHMYVAGFGPPEAMIFRGTHLLFALTLVFLLYPLKPGGGVGWRMLDMVLLIGSWAFILHIFFNYEYVTYRIIYIDDLTTFDKVYAVIAVLIVLEATRRVLGWALPITAFVFLAYAVFLTNVKLPILMEQLYLSTRGHLRPDAGGVGLLRDAVRAVRRVHGKERHRKAVHGLRPRDHRPHRRRSGQGFGGQLKPVRHGIGQRGGQRDGRRADDDPADETNRFSSAVRGGGRGGRLHRRGQIMPPVMGAAAFVMAEFMAVSYFQVTLWAAIPAILYYVAVFFSVHFKAKRVGLLGVPKSELPRLGAVMRERGHLFAPIVIVFVGLVAGYSAPLCALVGTLACLPIALLKKITREGVGWRSLIEALEDGARNTLLVAMACACAGIVIGCVTLTGLGISFTQLVVGLAREMLSSRSR